MTHPVSDAWETHAQRWRRRALTFSGYLVAGVALVALLPVLLPLAALADAIRGTRLAAVRVVLVGAHYLACELLGLAASLGLWISGRLRPNRERYLARHYALQAWWAHLLLAGVRRLFSLRLEIEGSESVGGGPVLVFIRHASIVDTLLPAALVSARQGLRLRYVLKRELLWDPCLDVVGNRLPNLFVRRNSGEGAVEAAKVARLAEGLGPDEGVLIYPEGTRFTPARRERALARIEGSGDASRLERARALRHVLPPRTGGPLALLDACPEADVLFVAHTGFEGISHVRHAWDGHLIGLRIRVRFWRVPRSVVPTERAKRIDWLYQEWERIDSWIGEVLDRPR